MLPTITKRSYNPFLSNIFDDDLFFGTANNVASVPAVNIKENEKAYYLEVAIPGVAKENLKIETKNDLLTISSVTKNESKEEKEGYRRKEFSYTSFCRSFYLPENIEIENINASYKDGILKVEIPKDIAEKADKNRSITIN